MPAGRPLILDDQKKAVICAMLAVGCTRATAARYVGCCSKTIRNAAAAADPQFHEQLEHAAAQAELNALENMQTRAKSSWRAAAWMLQTLNPRRYHRRPARVSTKPTPAAAAPPDVFARVVALLDLKQLYSQRGLSPQPKLPQKHERLKSHAKAQSSRRF